jgi:hypothetical protein
VKGFDKGIDSVMALAHRQELLYAEYCTCSACCGRRADEAEQISAAQRATSARAAQHAQHALDTEDTTRRRTEGDAEEEQRWFDTVVAECEETRNSAQLLAQQLATQLAKVSEQRWHAYLERRRRQQFSEQGTLRQYTGGVLTWYCHGSWW